MILKDICSYFKYAILKYIGKIKHFIGKIKHFIEKIKHFIGKIKHFIEKIKHFIEKIKHFLKKLVCSVKNMLEIDTRNNIKIVLINHKYYSLLQLIHQGINF